MCGGGSGRSPLVMIMQLFSRTFQAGFLMSAALIGTTFFLSNAVAQDENVFADDADPDREVIKLGDPAEITQAESAADLLVRTVAQSNPSSAVELVKAANLMVDIKRFKEANGYIDSLAALSLDGKAAYDLTESAGSTAIYVLARTAELQPNGREVALKIFNSATEYANSDARIDSLITQLGDENVYLRSEAFARLKRVGEKAVAKVIDVFADPDREPEYAGLRGALYAFGGSATGPLLGAARSDNASVKIEAIRGLLKQDSNEATDGLLHFALSKKTSDSLRDFTIKELTKSGRFLDRAQTEAKLANRVEKFLRDGRVSGESVFGDVTFWKWDTDRESLTSFEMKPRNAARLRAARLAKTLHESNPSDPRYRELYLLSRLEFEKLEVGTSRPIDVDAFLKSVNDINAEELDALLARCIRMDLIPAATACCEVLKKVGTKAQIVGSGRRPLVNAILTGDRHLQFAALDAIIEINPTTAYSGSSYVSELAAYLASSTFSRKAAVGHIFKEIAQSYTSSAQPLGWEVVDASSSVKFFAAATSDSDISVLMVSDTLTMPAYRQLVRQLRSHWKTKRMPIGVLASNADRLILANRHTDGVDRLLVFPLSTDRDAIASQLAQLEKLDSFWAVTSDDRFRHAQRAVEWLEEATVDPELGFYNFGSHQDQLLGLLYHPEFTSSAAKILASQPTAVAQRAMLGFVSQSDLPIEAREQVVDAFESAVNRGGTMLTTDDIELQYERYNASESLPVETQQVLGRVLDIIEARRKTKGR